MTRFGSKLAIQLFYCSGQKSRAINENKNELIYIKLNPNLKIFSVILNCLFKKFSFKI